MMMLAQVAGVHELAMVMGTMLLAGNVVLRPRRDNVSMHGSAQGPGDRLT